MLFTKRSHFNIRMLLLVIVSIFLMLLNQHQSSFKLIRAKLSLIVAPMQYLVSWPVQMLDWLQNSITSKQKLLADNAHLHAQIVLLNAQLQRYVSLKNENAALKALLRSSAKASDKVLVAKLLAVDSDPFMHQVILNKGSHDGVYPGQPVLDAYGVFGQVTQVSPLTSRVLLLTDIQSSVPVQDNRNGIRGILAGKGNSGELSLEHMPETSDIKTGDILVTSGLGGRYPFGYPVGVVEKVTRSSGKQFASINVRPSAHLYRSRLVLLVWPDTKSKA